MIIANAGEIRRFLYQTLCFFIYHKYGFDRMLSVLNSIYIFVK